MPFYAHLLLLLAGLADRATHLGGSPHLSCKRDQIKMRDYMDRRVTPPKRVTSPTLVPSPPCKQALSLEATHCRSRLALHDLIFFVYTSY